MNYSEEVYYRALKTRDQRFDGRFYTGVITTGIFCRPICPAVTPKQQNCRFFPTAAAAIKQGFRPCLRCRPESAPGSPAWNGSQTTVRRALSLIDEGVLHDAGLQHFAERLGVSTRHLRRLFKQHLGASPTEVAHSQRILFAKKLITETNLPLNQIAFSSGFGSVRRFNDAIQKLYSHPPSGFRRGASDGVGTGIKLKLTYQLPYDWAQVCRFLQTRAIAGVEEAGKFGYRRAVRFADGYGLLEAEDNPQKQVIEVRFDLTDISNLQLAVKKTRRLLDLDANRLEINHQLQKDPLLTPLISKRVGLGVPGAWDLFELAVRAVLGQQISVKAASTLAGRLVQRFGEPLQHYVRGSVTHLFPLPGTLAKADLSVIGLTKNRAKNLSAMAQVFSEKSVDLEAAIDLEQIENTLCRLPGVGPWTAQYIAMRALGEPDAFPVGDLGLIRAIEAKGLECDKKRLQSMAESWRPFRAYAAMHLWTED